MAILNSAAVYVDGINRTSRTVMPIKWGNFLDERLDECHLAIRHVKKKNFEPLTPVEIQLTNEIYWKTGVHKISERVREQTKRYIIANDSAVESPIGSGYYNHDLYLIEVTKIAECYAVDTLTFTNVMRVYGDDIGEYVSPIGTLAPQRDEHTRMYDYYKSPVPLGTSLQILTVTVLNGGFNYGIEPDKIKITYPDGTTEEYDDKHTYTKTLILDQLGTYTITYTGSSGISSTTYYDFSYTIATTENPVPLKKWTITDVINRTLDLAEPLRKGEKPRFRLNGMSGDGKIIPEGEDGAGQAARFNKILSPEMSFTKQTLRECLQAIGKVIHGEPRLTPKKDGDEWYYEVSYDMYASQDKSNIKYMPYITKSVQHVIENYTSYLDSNAENLVNQLDKYSGVMVEPYADGAKTLRTENMYVRIEEGNMIIPTQYPIYSVDKLEYVYADGGEMKSLDITQWLFEKSVYDTLLKSYSDAQPYSKAYGIYYAQGSKNIGGLNFKLEKPVLQAFEKYAIVNIISQASNKTAIIPTDYPAMAFRVTYTPFYNARVGQTKAYYKDFSRPAALIYNQQSNVIESRYYGENLKGAVARLGNIELSLTYFLSNLSQIPKAGQMFDKDYYISAVAVEFLPTVIKCTIGLSKDFNRLSSYIGISSVKRYSEISQTQAVERNTLYHEYIVIGEKELADTDCLINDAFLFWVGLTFFQGIESPVSGLGRITNVCAWGTTYQGNSAGGAVNLPVISSAFGNSISFSWKYQDNYSAGATSEYVENAFEGNVSGYFQNSYSYTDYYGRVYYYHFDLQPKGPDITPENYQQVGEKLPGGSVPAASSGFVSTIGQTPYVLRKDNREALQINFQIDFVTNLENMIIGSALASYNPAVRGTDARLAEARLYVFPTELNKFTDHVEAFEDVKLSDLPSAALKSGDLADGCWELNAENFPASGKSWAIVTPQYTKTETVEDETGEKYEQTQYYGGDLLIGQNIEVTAGQAFTPVYFTKKREIFDKTVWKERR